MKRNYQLMGMIFILFSFNPFVHSSLCKVDGIIKRYDKAYQICCEGRLIQRTTNLECCDGKQTYFSHKKICCNGAVSERWLPKQNNSKQHCSAEDPDCIEQICCGKELFSKQENMCCEGNKIPLSDTEVANRDFLACCGRNVFDIHEKMCCEKSLTPKAQNIGCCDNDVFLKDKFRCVNNKKVKIIEQHCGKIMYNATKHFCCGGQLVENVPEIVEEKADVFKQNPNAKCCGTNVIGKDKKCCKKDLFGFPTHSIANHHELKCCGLGSYNITSHFCLNGTAVAKSENKAQCGYQLYDTTFQACCSNKLVYNLADQQCCEGASFCVVNKNEICCNGFGMKENEICCDGIKPCKKRKENDDGCCYDHKYDNGQTYSKNEETCHHGAIMKVPQGNLPCGSQNYYDPKSHFCCNGKKYENWDGQCCNGVYSDIPLSDGRCCIMDNSVHKWNDEENPCLMKCNKDSFYDITSELCCQGKIFKYTGKNYCCGAYAIDGDEKSCCGDQFPYYSFSRRACCNNKQLYHKKYFRCNEVTGEVKYKKRKLLDGQKLCTPLFLKLFYGSVQEACRRDIAISGKIVNTTITQSKRGTQIHISITKVKNLKRPKYQNSGETLQQTDLTFNIHIAPGLCGVTHLNNLGKVIILFDLPPEGIKGNVVEISANSPFYFTPHTVLRRRTVTKVITESFCKAFS